MSDNLNKPHLFIAGTGRTGTSFLVQLLHVCGLETTISQGNVWLDEAANAGLETLPCEGGEHPYVVKSPWAYVYLEELLDNGLKLDAVILPIRSLNEAVSSRIILELQAQYRNKNHPSRVLNNVWHDNGFVPGGVTYSLEPLDQKRILCAAFYSTVEACVQHDIPIVFIQFPRFANEPTYTYNKLRQFFPKDFSCEAFVERFSTISSEDKIRTGKELAGITVANEPYVDLKPLSDLDKIALKRLFLDSERKLETLQTELVETRQVLEQQKQEITWNAAEAAKAKAEFEATKRELATMNARLEALLRSGS